MPEMTEMSELQKKTFEEAKKRASELMSSLYEIRNAFYINNTIPRSGDGVWRNIPRAQDLLTQIEALIDDAEGRTRVPVRGPLDVDR